MTTESALSSFDYSNNSSEGNWTQSFAKKVYSSNSVTYISRLYKQVFKPVHDHRLTSTTLDKELVKDREKIVFILVTDFNEHIEIQVYFNFAVRLCLDALTYQVSADATTQMKRETTVSSQSASSETSLKESSQTSIIS